MFRDWLQEKRSRIISERSVAAHTTGEGIYIPAEGHKVLFVSQNRWQIFTHEKRIFIALVEPELAPVERDITIWTIGLKPGPKQSYCGPLSMRRSTRRRR
jgi:hypothetical protein